ncbi:ParB/RepB/Spo0J family partition protein [Jannaschia formosa]|uniref:ParB/RepB/Spo0J family partition protein n=1 Tax=Jannaschia formosa TaxID=2259592 RepID=UPI000E1B6410|nr:ParB/RepB/Spo0J family partition protein [Jannaschia formosa]TFL16034.1 ParB/RepB/Spo0J family partition protein [Jannaschia formosa]
MARKVFGPAARLEGADGESAERGRKPLAKGGAGAPRYMQGSVEAEADRTYEDIPVKHIQDSPIEDRIDLTEDLQSLMDSIEANGQQIPVIVRIVDKTLPYEIVAGRRRLEAIRRLGRATIRGFVTRMSDEEAFVTQGIENSARLETSFIERARTAVKASQAGYSQERIGEFLAAKQSMISMMASVYSKIGEDLVRAIGPARGIGRRKWEKLARLLDEGPVKAEAALRLVDGNITDSAERFEAFLAAISQDDPRVPASSEAAKDQASSRPKDRETGLRRHLGGAITSTFVPGKLTLKARTRDEDGFLQFVAERIDELRSQYDQKEDREDIR